MKILSLIQRKKKFHLTIFLCAFCLFMIYENYLRVIDLKEHLEVTLDMKDILYDLKIFPNITDGLAVPADIFLIQCKVEIYF